MAHTHCYYKHEMWNGDGKHCIYPYRIQFFRDFTKQHPDWILNENTEIKFIYDCIDYDGIEPDLDGWYCDICKSVVVFDDRSNLRYDYIRMNEELVPTMSPCDWEEYVAPQHDEFLDFLDFENGKHPIDALLLYPFQYRYKVSKDKKWVLAYSQSGTLQFTYQLASIQYLP